MNIAVVDDEGCIREQLKILLKKVHEDYRVDTYTCGEELLENGRYYDIIILDIQMDGLNGLETARELRRQQKESILIFLTGMKEYVFEAFDVAAFHYLLKPVEEKRLQEVFLRAVAEVERRGKEEQKRIFIKTRTRNYSLNQKEILYIESRAKKVEIHTVVERIEAYASMRDLEKQLGKMFFRCHRGYLVNMAYVAEYSSDSITLNNGEVIILAKERYSDFVKEYMRYLKNGGTVCD